jgi:hypothetical protein
MEPLLALFSLGFGLGVQFDVPRFQLSEIVILQDWLCSTALLARR